MNIKKIDDENQNSDNKFPKPSNQQENENIDQFKQIFAHISDGVAIVGFDDNLIPSVEFFNKTGIKMLETNPQFLLDELKKLKDLQFKKKQDDYVESLFQFQKFKQSSNDATKQNKQSEQTNFPKNPFEMVLENAIGQIRNREVNEHQKKLNDHFHFLNTLYGCTKNPSKPVHLKIKLFISFIEKPKLIIIIKDISLKKQMKILDQQAQANSKFLSFVVHEFRFPLHSIIERLESENKNENIKTALANCMHIDNLIKDILDLNLVKARRLRLNKAQFNLENLINKIYDLFQFQIQRKNVNLKIQFEQGIPINIYNDELRIRQVLMNLISNSLKFTPSGTITIKVEKSKAQSLIISVIDTGIGIRQEDLLKITNEFEKKNLGENGVGLGLFVSNLICEQLSVNSSGLVVNSEYHKGSTFSFEIDCRSYDDIFEIYRNTQQHQEVPDRSDIDQSTGFASASVQVSQEQSTFSHQIVQEKDVLIIDNPFCVDAVQLMFNNRGVTRIESAINGQIAKQILERNAATQTYFKVIIINIDMPGMDGFQTANMIKQYIQEKFNRIPIMIGLSGQGMNIKQSVLDAGFTDYFQKPLIENNAIEIIISKYLS